MDLTQAVDALNAALIQTEEVRRFRAVRERAKADPAARAAMERYLVQFRNLASGSTAPAPADWQALQRVQQNLALNPVLQEYMQAEAALGRLLHRVMETAATACGLESDAPRR